MNTQQIEIIRKVTNQYINRKEGMLNEGEKFATRFNLGRMAENIEIELVNQAYKKMFPITKEQTIKVITDECLKVLTEEITKRGI